MIIHEEPTGAFTLVSHAARRRGVKRAWVYYLIQHGKGPRVWQPEPHNGGTLYTTQAEFDEWLMRHVQASCEAGQGLCGSGYRPNIGVADTVRFRTWVHTVWEDSAYGNESTVNPIYPQLRLVGGTHA